MLFIAACLLLGGAWTVVLAETHSLTYVYTAFTSPVNLPGIHQFSAMGLLDDRPIDYYDSTTHIKVPKETWMANRLGQEYWDKGTSSRETKQQWFKVNLGILTDRLKKNGTENHVLQWRHGCGYTEENSKRIVTGNDMYSYDGEDFLSFDSKHKQWVAPMSEAVVTKRKWDLIQQLNDYTDGYLHNECVQWLDTFLKYSEEAGQEASRPDVYLYAKQSDNELKLSCMATGFYPKEITLNIKRGAQILDRSDGLESTGILPNGDGTNQIKKWVSIQKTDDAKYTCEVKHRATNIDVVKVWDQTVDSGPNTATPGWMIGASLGGVFGLVVIGTVSLLIRQIYLLIRQRKEKMNREQTGTPGCPVNSGLPLTEDRMVVSSEVGEQMALMKGKAQDEISDSGQPLLPEDGSQFGEQMALMKGKAQDEHSDSGNSSGGSASSLDSNPSV